MHPTTVAGQELPHFRSQFVDVLLVKRLLESSRVLQWRGHVRVRGEREGDSASPRASWRWRQRERCADLQASLGVAEAEEHARAELPQLHGGRHVLLSCERPIQHIPHRLQLQLPERHR